MFKPTYPVSLTKLTLALIWLMDYISKCDVVLVVIKEIAPSKRKNNQSQHNQKQLLKITKNNCAKFVSFNFGNFCARYKVLQI